MSLSRKIRNIALSQINAIKEHLDRIDEEEDLVAEQRRVEKDARRELAEALETPGPTLRTPEEIVEGRRASSPAAPPASVSREAAPASPLARHYRVLGLEEGADLSAVDAAYAKLAARCAPDRFVEGSEEQKAAQEILARVEIAYSALRDALNPTAGRFDKLEL